MTRQPCRLLPGVVGGSRCKALLFKYPPSRVESRWQFHWFNSWCCCAFNRHFKFTPMNFISNSLLWCCLWINIWCMFGRGELIWCIRFELSWYLYLNWIDFEQKFDTKIGWQKIWDKNYCRSGQGSTYENFIWWFSYQSYNPRDWKTRVVECF